MERTFIMIKPEGIQRNLIGLIINRFEQKGLKLIGMKLMHPNKSLLKEHYKELNQKSFFNDLIKRMNSGPVISMIWEGYNAIKVCRNIIGKTNPCNSEPGTIRGDFGLQTERNVIHGSDSAISANREIKLWFKENEIVNYYKNIDEWIYSNKINKI